MKFNEFLQKIKPYAPLGAAVAVALGVVISLSGYQAKAYEPGTQVTEQTDETESAQNTSDTDNEADSTATGSFDLEDGVYKGSATGYRGTVTVAVTIMNKSITSIDILSSSDDEAFFNRAKGVIDKIISAQSLDVDVVSGATYSSNGIIGAVKNALTGERDSGVTGETEQAEAQSNGTEASSEVQIATVTDADGYKDGTYYGTGKGFAGEVKVKVDISGGKIAAISIVSTKDGDSYIKSASSILDSIVEKQSTNVDTVSGATFSSRGIIEAVRSALSQAVVNTDANSSDNTGSAENTSSDASDTSSDSSTDNDQDVTGTLPYVDGIYYGTADGYKGDIKVAVVIQDKTLKAILVTEKSDDEPFISNAMDVLKNIMKKQSADVDTVSGATYSSKGLIGAVKAAFEEAGKTTAGESTPDDGNSGNEDNNTATEQDKTTLLTLVNSVAAYDESQYTQMSWLLVQIRNEDAKEILESGESTKKEVDRALEKLQLAINSLQKLDTSTNVYEDGTYEVTTLCIPDEDMDFSAYDLSMKVTISNDRIVSITDVKGNGGSGNDSYINKAVNGTSKLTGVVTQITSQGSADSIDLNSIDTVSRATCTSKAIIEGCKSALESARITK